MSNFTTSDDSDFLSQDTTAASAGDAATTKRHLLLKVPDYEHTGSPGTRTLEPPTWSPNTSKKNTFITLGDADAYMAGSAAGDGNDLLTGQYAFEDDTRYRGTGSTVGGTFDSAASATPPSETDARAFGAYSKPGATTALYTTKLNEATVENPQTDFTNLNIKATADIPSYVGWRDHTDGHRITTTRGDKVEVVGGNYKLVSLGRGTGVASYEMSGGIISDSMEAPGNVTSVTWRTCPTAPRSKKGWKWVEQTEFGHVIERYHGTMREEFFGDKLISVVGSPDEKLIGPDGRNRVDENMDGADEEGLEGGWAQPTKWDRSGSQDDTFELTQPEIYESTWAKSVNTYSKVEGTVKNEETYNGKVESVVYSQKEMYSETWHMAGGPGFHEYFYGAMTQFFIGASTTVGVANRFELFLGIEEQFNLGFTIEMLLGLNLKLCAALSTEVETTGLRFWLAKADTGLADLETKLNETKTLMIGNDAILVKNSVGLSENAPKMHKML